MVAEVSAPDVLSLACPKCHARPNEGCHAVGAVWFPCRPHKERAAQLFNPCDGSLETERQMALVILARPKANHEQMRADLEEAGVLRGGAK